MVVEVELISWSFHEIMGFVFMIDYLKEFLFAATATCVYFSLKRKVTNRRAML